MDIHDLIVNELFNKKSIAALIFLIDCGRELEFKMNGKEYFISFSVKLNFLLVFSRAKRCNRKKNML